MTSDPCNCDQTVMLVAIKNMTKTMLSLPGIMPSVINPLKKRIQIYPQEINVGYSFLRQHLTESDVQKITHHPKPLLNNLSYVLFPKKVERSKTLLLKFNKQLKKFRESGRYEKYFEAFHQGDYRKNAIKK